MERWGRGREGENYIVRWIDKQIKIQTDSERERNGGKNPPADVDPFQKEKGEKERQKKA